LEKHRLDQATEDILQHYGIKGMKWDVRRSPEELAAAREAMDAADASAGYAAESELEAREMFPEFYKLIDAGEALVKKMDAMNKKIEEVGDNINETVDSIKSKGKSVLTSIFGKGGDGKWKPAKPNKKLTENFKRDVKDQTPNRMAAKAAAQLKGMSKTEQRNAKKPVRKTYKTTYGPASRTTEKTVTRKGFLGIPVTKTQKTTSYTTKDRLR
jgi:hypothetical protein